METTGEVTTPSSSGGSVRARVQAFEAAGAGMPWGMPMGSKRPPVRQRKLSYEPPKRSIPQKKRNQSYHTDVDNAIRGVSSLSVDNESAGRGKNCKSLGGESARGLPPIMSLGLQAVASWMTTFGFEIAGRAAESRPEGPVVGEAARGLEMDAVTPLSMGLETAGGGPCLSPEGQIVKGCVTAHEGETQLQSEGPIVQQRRLSYNPPERIMRHKKRNQSFDVGVESTEVAKRLNLGAANAGRALSGGVDRAVGLPGLHLGPDQQPVGTSLEAPEMDRGVAPLNIDLEAPEGMTAPNPEGRTVRPEVGALEAATRQTPFETDEQSVRQRRRSYDPPAKAIRETRRNESLVVNFDSAERETRSDFGVHDDSPGCGGAVREGAEMTDGRHIPLSFVAVPARGVPSSNSSVEAARVLSSSVHVADGGEISSVGVEAVAAQEVTNPSVGADTGAAAEATQERLGLETFERQVTYVGFGVDTGARRVTPLTLGVATAGGVMKVLIPRNTNIPTTKEEVFSTFVDNQTEVCIQIFEGERFRTMDNRLLGTFELSGIPPAPRGVARILVSLDIDAKGILNVFVKDKNTGKKKQVTITSDIARLSKEMIEEMILDAEENKSEDEEHKKRIQSKSSLESYTYQLRDWITDVEVCKNLDPDDKEKMDDAVESVINWLLYKSWLFHCYNQLGEAAEFNHKEAELKSICMPILEKIYQNLVGL